MSEPFAAHPSIIGRTSDAAELRLHADDRPSELADSLLVRTVNQLGFPQRLYVARSA